MNDTIRALSERKSVRIFNDKPIDEPIKQALFQAALQAPTAGNQTLYTILDITQPARKEKLAELCDHQSFIADAPLVLVFLADCQRWYDIFTVAECAPRHPGAGDLLLATADAVIAAQNVVVAAESFGLGSCYIGDVLEHCEAMRELLCLPNWVVPAAMLVIGYPTLQQTARKKPQRFAPEYIVQKDTYTPATAQMHRDFYLDRAARGGHSDIDWQKEITAFCTRKYQSDFSREMSRSAGVYLSEFIK